MFRIDRCARSVAMKNATQRRLRGRDAGRRRTGTEREFAGSQNAVGAILMFDTVPDRMSAPAFRMLRERDVQRICAGFAAAIRHAAGDS